MGDVAEWLIDQEMFGDDNDDVFGRGSNKIPSRKYEKRINWQRNQLSNLIDNMIFKQVDFEFNYGQRRRRRKSWINEFCILQGFKKRPGDSERRVYRSQSNFTFNRLEDFKDFLRKKREDIKKDLNN